jgi:hypothetical protein
MGITNEGSIRSGSSTGAMGISLDPKDAIEG